METKHYLFVLIFVLIFGTFFQTFYILSKLKTLNAEIIHQRDEIEKLSNQKEKKVDLKENFEKFQSIVNQKLTIMSKNIKKEIQLQIEKFKKLEISISSLHQEGSVISALLDRHIEDELKEKYKDNIKKRLLTLKTSKSIFQDIQKNQFPSGCDDQKFLVCKMRQDCGFGCQLHKIMSCLNVALSTKRVLAINSLKWTYFNVENDHYKCPKEKNKETDYFWRCFLRKVTHCKLNENELRNALDFTHQLHEK